MSETVDAEIAIEAPVEAVWEALSTGEGLASWFPPQAEVEEGEGGSIVLNWEGFYRWEMNIDAWEPPRHLRTVNILPEGAEAKPPAIDFHLEAEGKHTKLSVVHSGFAAGYDEMLETVARGWRYELRSLKQYLELHRGKERNAVYLFHPVMGEPEEIWMQAFNREAFILNMSYEPQEGMPCGMRTLGGDEFHGRLVFWEQPWQFVMTVETMNDGLLRVELDPYRDGRALTFTLSTWDCEDAEKIERIRKRTSVLLARIAQLCEEG